MTHTIDCKQATTPHWRARVCTSGRQPVGEACAVVGSRAWRVFALRNREAGSGHKQMRSRAFAEGGVP